MRPPNSRYAIQQYNATYYNAIQQYSTRYSNQPIRLSNTQPNATNLQQYNCDTAYVRQQYRAICDTAVQQRTTTDTTRPRNNCNRDTQAIQQYSRLRYVLPSIPPAEFAIKRYQYNLQHHPPNSQYASDTAVQPRITTLRYPYSTPCSDTTQPLRCARSCTRNGQQYSREL